MVRTQVYFTREQHTALRREAQRNGVSLTEALRRLVDRHLLAKGSPEAMRERIFEFIGSGESGISDVAERHDEYLAQSLGDADLR